MVVVVSLMAMSLHIASAAANVIIKRSPRLKTESTRVVLESLLDIRTNQ